jgi:hypothetical protein
MHVINVSPAAKFKNKKAITFLFLNLDGKENIANM